MTNKEMSLPIKTPTVKAAPGLTAEQIISAELKQGNPAGCIEWPGRRDADGYGLIQVNKTRHRVHRTSYELAYGPIPTGLLVRHTCDNPPCFNPRHLLVGTFHDNTWDSVERKRNNFGERHHFTPFAESDIRTIRQLHAGGESIRGLARRYGVAKNAISNIVKRKSWKHVD